MTAGLSAAHRQSQLVPVQPPRNRENSAHERELESVDAEVKAHEATHLAALGAVAGGPASFDYLILPNGEKIAVGGSVPVNVSPVPGDPEATIRKAKILIEAAYAVGMPSAADMQVAAEAYEMEVAAQGQLDQAGQDRQDQPPGQQDGPQHEWVA